MKLHSPKQMSPDEAPAGGAAPAGGDTPKSNTLNKDMDILTVAEDVAARWIATPDITLAYKSAADFSTLVGNYRTALTGRRSAGSFRPSQTQTLNNMDAAIDEAVGEVKTYIDKKFKKDATAQFARYGIVKKNKSYVLPHDRDERKEALPLMIAAIAADGFGTEEYGTAFWTQMNIDYPRAINDAKITDSTVSGKVGSKNVLKKEIKMVMTSLRLILKGNFPETYLSVYREWGWQKEDYS